MERDGVTRVYFGNFEVYPNEVAPEQVVRNSDEEAKKIVRGNKKIDYICVSEPAMSQGTVQQDRTTPSHGVKAEYVWSAYPVDKSNGKINEDAEPIDFKFESAPINHFQAISKQLEKVRKTNASGWGLSIMVTDRRFLDQHRPKKSVNK